jgi:periplasmic divalent cation tolerance protein
MTDAIQIVTTTAQQSDAQKIATALVEQRLAACVQISGPITSTYRWQGEVESAQEWICTIKTRRDLYDEVEQVIRQLHPYEQPEILATPIVAGSAGYLQWLDEEVKARR